MSTPHQASPSPAPSNGQFPFNPNFNNPPQQYNPQGNPSDPRLSNMNFLGNQPQQQYMQNLSTPSSSVPGASGGRGDPGPNSMAQQNQQNQSQATQGQQFRPPFPQGNMGPRQLQMLQQLHQASQPGPNGQSPQINQQQMAMAMANLQAQGGQMNPQMLAAMRNGFGQVMGQGQNQGQQYQQQPPMDPNQIGQMSNQPGQQAGNPPTPVVQQAMLQQQRIQALMQQQQMQGRPGQPNTAGSPRPPQQGQGGMMPPPVPMSNNSPRPPPVGTPINQQFPARPPQPFSLTPQQQQMLAAQQANIAANPQFQALPPQQQQQQMQLMMHHQMRNFMAQHQQAQAGQQQQQPVASVQQTGGHRPSSAQGMSGQSQQSPVMQRQQPPNNQQIAQQQQQQQHLSGLPQHMAPPRPASAASQRGASPHPSMAQGGQSPSIHGGNGTPPANPAMYPAPSAPSPTSSNHSHHSQQTIPHQPSSPMNNTHFPAQPQFQNNQQQPNQPQSMNQPQSHVQNFNVNGMTQPQGMNSFQQPQTQFQGQPARPTPVPQAAQAIQALQQHAQNAQSMVQNGQLSGGSGVQPGVGPFPPNAPGGMTSLQQQQMQAAMGLFSQAAQAQGVAGTGTGQPPVRPNNTPQGMARPPPPANLNINTSDFPFDFRLLAYIHQVNDPRWVADMQQRQPQLLQAARNAADRVNSNQIRPDVLQRMNQLLLHQARMTVAAQSGRQQSQGATGQPTPVQGQIGIPPHLQQQLSQSGIGLPGQPQAVPGMSLQQQQRLWAGQQGGQGMTPPPGMNNIRPPLPHVPPPDSPLQNVASGVPPKSRTTSKDKPRERTPSQSSMPPPAWIPSHPGGTPVTGNLPVPPNGVPQPSPATSEATPVAAPPGPSTIPVKEWESHLRLDLPITHITPLPTSTIDENVDPTFGGILPELSENEKKSIKSFMMKDFEYVPKYTEQKGKIQKKMFNWAKNEDMATPWWMMRKGQRFRQPMGRLSIIWPEDKKLWRSQNSHRGRREIRFTPAQLKAMGNVEDQVVPVRLDLEHDHWKLKDTFMWNCSDTVVTPQIFAQTLCDDFKLPPNHFIPKIITAIQERVREYQDQVLPMIQSQNTEERSGRGKLDAETLEFGASFGKVQHEGSSDDAEVKTDDEDQGGVDDKIRIVGVDDESSGVEIKVEDEVKVKKEERPMTVDEVMADLPRFSSDEELRIVIKVDIIVGTQALTDSFEWDLSSSVTPEDFAASYVKDLGLSWEFATALAHDIHEQILVHKRSLFLVGHTFGAGMILDDDVRSAFLPPLSTALRKEDLAMANFTPIFNNLSEVEIERLEKEREKDNKRKKRATRGRRGIILPDREPIKTQRSLLSNGVDPNGILVNPPAVEVPVVAPTTSRRAAAIAASANINLMAQDLPIPSPPTPPPAPLVQVRGRRPGRIGRGGGRASPASTREGSVVGSNVHGGDTPSATSFKRILHDDSGSEVNSPAPGVSGSRKRHNGRIADTPEGDEGEGAEGDINKAESMDVDGTNQLLGGKRKIDSDDGGTYRPVKTSKKNGHGSGTVWHCKNCGVSQGLSGGIKKDSKGDKTLCAMCAKYQAQHGKKRPCDYTEDEEYHRNRLEYTGDRRIKDSSSIFADESTTPSDEFRSNPTSPDKVDINSNLPGKNTMSLKTVDSSISSRSGDDSDSEFGKNGKLKSTSEGGGGGGNTTTTTATGIGEGRSKITPGRSMAPPSPAVSPSLARKPTIDPPSWLMKATDVMRSRYPKHQFAVVQRARRPDVQAPPPDAAIEWRIKCMDCPGKIYTPGPGESLANFEVHLKNRAHITRVLQRDPTAV